MTVTDVLGAGGLALGGSAETEFTHSAQVDSDIQILWDFGVGLEDITSYLYEAECSTGRDWPSQLQGKAGPGRLQVTLDNRDNRFSYFNASSPLNQGGRSLDPGGKIRIQVAGTTDVDPVLLARDRFDGTGPITADELGTPWEHQTAGVWSRVDGDAVAPTAGQASEMLIDAGVADYYVQVTVAELGDHCEEVAGFQEVNAFRLIYRWQDSSNYSYLSYGPADGLQQHVIEAFDVVAGTPTSIYGLFADVNGETDIDSPGDHRRRVTLGVHVTGAVVAYYVNGTLHGIETALQTDETHVGLYAYWGAANRQPAIDEFAVWDRFPLSTEGVIWTGHVVDVFPEATPGAPNTVTVTAEGTLAQLAQADIAPQPWAGGIRTGRAMGEAIQQAGLLYPPGEIAAGDKRAGSSADTEINALTHCRKLEEVEAGFLHEAPEGWLVFRDRSYRDALTVQAVFSDAPGAQFGYHGFELLQWRRELINKVTAGVSYGAPRLILGGFAVGATATGVARTVPFTFPASGIADGDLFIVIISSTIADASENWLVPLWWVRERDSGASASRRSQVYTHIAAAADAGMTATFYTDSASAGGSFVLHYIQIRDWFGTHEGIHIGEWLIGADYLGATPDPIMPPWGDTNPSYFSAYRAGIGFTAAGAITDPVYPVGYRGTGSQFQNGTSANVDDCGLQEGSKQAMTALEAPGSFAGFVNLFGESAVIAVRGRNGSPAEPRGRLRVTVEDTDSQRRHNTIAAYDGTDLFRTEADASEWCDLMLTRYGSLRPIVRITFTATISGAYRAQAYRRRLGDKIRVVATSGTGMGIDADMHIESIRHRWTNAGKLWQVTYELSPA